MAVLERIRYRDLDGLRTGHFNLAPATSFVIYRLGDTLIDAGPRNQWRHIRRFVDERAVRQLLITHFHEDHSGNSANLARHLRLTPRTSEETGRQLRHGFSIQWYRRIVWGAAAKVLTRPFDDDLIINGCDRVTPIATPGHTPDLTCFHLPDRGWLFSGDMYISSRLKLLEREEDLSQILASLRHLLALEFELILCPHRGPVTEGKPALQRKYNYLIELVEHSHHLHQQGYPLAVITRRLLGRENWMSYMTGFDFSKRQLIRACLGISQEKMEGH